MILKHFKFLLNQLRDPSYLGEAERAIIFKIEAWDVNCPQHIHKRFSQQVKVNSMIKQFRLQVQELGAKLDLLGNKENHSDGKVRQS